MPAISQVSPQSTHDWTSTPPPPPTVPDWDLFDNADLNEVWADTKSPGDGSTYSVGSIEIRDTILDLPDGPEFSGVVVGLPPDSGAAFSGGAAAAQFVLPVAGTPPRLQRRQVVVLQKVNSLGGIEWQRYFYGGSPELGVARYRRATNARAVSVWPGATPEETRIAICGEQNDNYLPVSQAPSGWVFTPILAAPKYPYSGFIAVYKGDGELLWTHHFFGSAPAVDATRDFDCAITDVSMRVEGLGDSARDVVTYCGISELGNPSGGNAWLTPILAFAPVNGSGGTSDFGAGPGNFDGMVGRLSRSHALFASDTTTTEFHSVVGGPGSDGLFGIAEMEDQMFVVVGSTDGMVQGGVSFPFNFVAPLSGLYRVGTAMTFDASPTRQNPPLPLILVSSAPLGTRGQHPPAMQPRSSIARDVVVHLDSSGPVWNTIDIVGATDDPDFFASFGPFQQISVAASLSSFDLSGSPSGSVPKSEGFFLSCQVSAGYLDFSFAARPAGFIGGPGADGLTGVSSWNEYPDHVLVCGYTEDENGNIDIDVASLLVGIPGTISPSSGNPELTIINRRTKWGGSAEDRPAVMGPQSVQFDTALGPSTSYGSHAGGGIGVDPRARLTVVGATKSTDYPTTASAFQPLYGLPRPTMIPTGNPNSVTDAVRTEFDMLPVGVGRSDGTGSKVGPVPAPLPLVGATGGTTPTAALGAFGRRVGETGLLLKRMMVDYEGANVVGATPALIFTRPSTSAMVIGTVLQFGFPTASPNIIDGVEFWLDDPSAVMLLDPWFGTVGSWRFPFGIALGAVPGTNVISTQLISLITCDSSTWVGSTCALFPALGLDMTVVGCPAMFFQF